MLIVYTIIRVYDLFKSISLTFSILTGYLIFSAICFYFGIVINVITPVVMFIITMSENYVQNAFFVILILYGFSVADKGEPIVVEDIINENCRN